MAKQMASQYMMKKIHPEFTYWGSVIRLYEDELPDQLFKDVKQSRDADIARLGLYEAQSKPNDELIANIKAEIKRSHKKYEAEYLKWKDDPFMSIVGRNSVVDDDPPDELLVKGDSGRNDIDDTEDSASNAEDTASNASQDETREDGNSDMDVDEKPPTKDLVVVLNGPSSSASLRLPIAIKEDTHENIANNTSTSKVHPVEVVAVKLEEDDASASSAACVAPLKQEPTEEPVSIQNHISSNEFLETTTAITPPMTTIAAPVSTSTIATEETEVAPAPAPEHSISSHLSVKQEPAEMDVENRQHVTSESQIIANSSEASHTINIVKEEYAFETKSEPIEGLISAEICAPVSSGIHSPVSSEPQTVPSAPVASTTLVTEQPKVSPITIQTIPPTYCLRFSVYSCVASRGSIQIVTSSAFTIVSVGRIRSTSRFLRIGGKIVSISGVSVFSSETT
jgi:hypothetical protein